MCPEDQTNMNVALDPAAAQTPETAPVDPLKAAYDTIATLDQRVTTLEAVLAKQEDDIKALAEKVSQPTLFASADGSPVNPDPLNLEHRINTLEQAVARQAGR